jgi:hypothetical protein
MTALNHQALGELDEAKKFLPLADKLNESSAIRSEAADNLRARLAHNKDED